MDRQQWKATSNVDGRLVDDEQIHNGMVEGNVL